MDCSSLVINRQGTYFIKSKYGTDHDLVLVIGPAVITLYSDGQIICRRTTLRLKQAPAGKLCGKIYR